MQLMKKDEGMKYMVSHQGQELPPLTLDEIAAKVRGKDLELFDYIYDQHKQDWILLMEYAELAAKLKSNKPTNPPRADAHAMGEWFVLKGENKFGPFGYNDVLKMLQSKSVFPFDHIWHSSMEKWTRIAEIPEFREEHIRDVYSRDDKKNEGVFSERKFKRIQFNGRVICHDNVKLWHGVGFEISKGGVGLTMSNALVNPGQEIHVHFHGHEDFPPFNALCEVVSKKFVNDDTPIQYGLRFLNISQDAQEDFYKKVA